MILAHINAGDLERAVDWFDGMQSDGQERNYEQESEIERIRKQIGKHVTWD
jgi:pentatricopeptide repeat protein